MAYLIAIHRLAEDSLAYRKHYFEIHVPLAKALPGLRKYEVSAGPVLNGNGQPAAELVAVMEFDSQGAIQTALEGPEGKAALRDLPNFARPGQIELMVFDTQIV